MNNEYLKLFIDKEYPSFIDKYLNTNTLNRIKYIGQFCGCDYTKLYSPLYFYSRFEHSLVVAHMTWHFTHDKLSTIAALLHDIGTPCFAHTIDVLLNDAINQESSEIDIIELIKKDNELLKCLKEDNISLEDLKDLSKYPILENKSPKLCTDRLDGVLHTCYIWLHTHSIEDIKEVYNNITVLNNEDNKPELGFTDINISKKFADMIYIYSIELQSNRNKFLMKYISDALNVAFKKKLFTINDLYTKKEQDIVNILANNISSWQTFTSSTKVSKTNNIPKQYHIHIETKKRTVTPLLSQNNKVIRINEIPSFKSIYNKIKNYKDKEYAYIKEIYEI